MEDDADSGSGTSPISEQRAALLTQKPRDWVSPWPRVLIASVVAASFNILASALVLLDWIAYAGTLFIATPICAGMIGSLVLKSNPNTRGGDYATFSLITPAITLGMILLLAMEGIACVIIAAPFVLFGVWIGCLIGVFISGALPIFNKPRLRMLSLCLPLVLPIGSGLVESGVETDFSASRVTAIEVDAPPNVVWKYVVAFPQIPEFAEGEERPPTFRLGYPQPVRCDIDGEGVGAMRHCIFTRGQFDEPVEVWIPGRELTFGVASQPKRLDPVISVHRGQFLLDDLENGRTRITGTTWFTSHMAPEWYWENWCDWLLRDIHDRVLLHVKKLAEAEAQAGAGS